MPYIFNITHADLPPPIGDIEYIYSDEHIIVVDKPANMLSVPGKTPDKQDCLIHRIQKFSPEARIVHRLDFSTSGIMVIAQNHESQRKLGRQFENRETEKTYIAKIFCQPDNTSGMIDLPIRCDWERRPLQIVDHQLGKKAVTRWKIQERFEDSSLLELSPVTGRTHQLRVHMQAMGHPILGDELYAHEAAHSMAERLCLHAKELIINHPAENSRMTFSSTNNSF
ncbi:pseudouridylate synthases, 23S RNA-specific [Candidatus Scalindua japonica]|uniref:Pseudouridine synthase n=1 Tax=Candidatus Scalindua japonica TaxID=1284222 RepID=A0A286U1V5_9BACT|nr:RluA family pseudouridine synthase [Candidatus Scalindua japonica]GAX62106.1 pseudouridylate synthases, 23S RNA-specific [Candidatus Scalindua japonica]